MEWKMKISKSSTPAEDSSLCDACRGLFDLSNPRGFVIDRHGESHHNGAQSHPSDCECRYRFTYTYIHHKNVFDLLASSLTGCGICKIFCDSLRLKEIESLSEWFPGAPPLQGRSPNESASRTHAAEEDDVRLEESSDRRDTDKAEIDDDEFNEDNWEPSELAENLRQQQDLCDDTDIIKQCNGRVVITHDFEELASLASHADAESSAVYCSALEEICAWSDGQFHHFTSPFDPMDPDWKHGPSKDLLSDCHTGLINRWRDTCDKEHKSCQKISYEQPLPTRVLEILEPTDRGERVRLVETKGRKHGMYACLSYCWGDLQTQGGRTTRRNLSSHLKGIPLHDLPSTVIDAIQLCSKLGYRSLWVDRLCIVQDDREDWLREASRMCELYGRSALTIAVSICKDSSQSFLADREKGFRDQHRFATLAEPNSNKSMRWFSIEWPKQKPKEGPWFLEDRWANFQNRETGHQGIGHRENRWLGRSWTFQEWMLSPRVLHIDTMTLWDCFDGYANELNYRNMVSARLLRDPSRFGEDIVWESIIQEYSGREITHEEDRLPALAGLAERYAHATGKTYLAGLWLEGLPHSLLWQQRSRNLPPQAWCASLPTPSWSWSSLKRPVWYLTFTNRYRDNDFSAMASIRSASRQSNSAGSFTGLEKAWIDMSCQVSAVTRRYYDTHKHSQGVFYNHKVDAGGEKWSTAPDYDYDHGNSDRNNVENVYLLLLGQGRASYGALIAKRFNWDDGRFCFRRLGVAYLESSWTNSEDFSQWEEQVIRLV